MRVSKYFGVPGTQGTYDFIDVYVDRDVPLFIDPSALATLNSPWAAECSSSIQSYFQRVLDEVVAGNEQGALDLMGYLREENATHLGYSQTSQGSGVGEGLAQKFYDELVSSSAVTSGLITDLEDTALLVAGIEEDRISDVTTNIIRKQLAQYTAQVAKYYSIPLTSGLTLAGPEWDNDKSQWQMKTYDLPLGPQGPLLLVPKAITRRKLFLNADEYYTWYVMEKLVHVEGNKPVSPFIKVFKNGSSKVMKTALGDELKKKAKDKGKSVRKRINTETTEEHPEILDKYRETKAKDKARAPSAAEVAAATETDKANLDKLLADVLAVPSGHTGATAYERAIEALLAALFYPDLLNPTRQLRIHDGRKIIDITYTNAGHPKKFFGWLGNQHPAGLVFAECKNYSGDLGNKEFDQLAGRFSPSRSKYGLLVCRKISDKPKTTVSCRDTAKDDRGLMTALDDDDLKSLVSEFKAAGSACEIGGLLYNKFLELVA